MQQPFDTWALGGTFLFHFLLLTGTEDKGKIDSVAQKTPGLLNQSRIVWEHRRLTRREILFHELSSMGMSLFLVICQRDQLAGRPPRKCRAFVKKPPFTYPHAFHRPIFPIPAFHDYSSPSQQFMDRFYEATVSDTAFSAFVSSQEVYKVTVRSEAASWMRPVLELDLRVFYLFTRSDLKTIVLPVVCMIPPLSSSSCLSSHVRPSLLISQPPMQTQIVCYMLSYGRGCTFSNSPSRIKV